MRANNIYSTQIRATSLQYAHFQDLTRNDQEMTRHKCEMSFMTINDQKRQFSFAIHEQSLNEIF